jgi:alpha-beta hydrolase superfamily lysophospholipase
MGEGTFSGTEGRVFYRTWTGGRADHLVVLVHGYAEHVGRYEHVADALVARGGVVYGPDHLGHGRSDGERALIRDFEHVVDDLRTLVGIADWAYPGLPMVMIGHSMGGLVAIRYTQRYANELAGLVLSGPVVGNWQLAREVLVLPEIPEEPLDINVLSRDPAVGQSYAEDPLVYRGPFHRPTLEAFVATLERANAELDRVTLPVLHLHGTEDELVPLDQVRGAVERLGSARLVQHLYEEARHEVFNELNADEVLDAVNDFIELLTRERGRRPS